MELSRNDLVSVLQEPLAAMHESLNQQRDAQARRRIPPFLAGMHLNLSPFSWHVPVTVFPSFPVNSQASSAALSAHASSLQKAYARADHNCPHPVLGGKPRISFAYVKIQVRQEVRV